MRALERADFGVIGEGELTIVALCNALENDTPLDQVLGIIYKNSDGLAVTGPRPAIDDLDSLPLPDYDGFDMETYFGLPSETYVGLSGNKLYCLSSRSCPYGCTFCFHTLGRKYRSRSPALVLDEIQMLHAKYGVEQIFFVEELFAQDKEKVRVFAEKLKELNIHWYANFRLDQVDAELLAIIKNSTCAQMFFGVESVTNHILKSMNKNLTVELIEKNLKMVYAAKIPFGGNLLFGDTEDTLETCRNSLAWYKAHPEYNLTLTNITTYPGTAIYNKAIAQGKIKDRIRYLQEGCPIINISKMTDSEYAVMQQELLEVAAGFPLNNQRLLNFYPQTKHAAIAGNCKRCNAEVSVYDVLPLTTDYAFIYCPHCGAKHRFDLPERLRKNLFSNLEALLEKKQKIAIWGVQPATWNLFNDADIFAGGSITFIDSNQGRQLLKLTKAEKSINAPHILQVEQFDCVIFCYPNLYLSYTALIKNQYPLVGNFIDILDLLALSD